VAGWSARLAAERIVSANRAFLMHRPSVVDRAN
jgi:hypothetical protein